MPKELGKSAISSEPEILEESTSSNDENSKKEEAVKKKRSLLGALKKNLGKK